jgi:formate/nitrite transporter FocA (FNT family)
LLYFPIGTLIGAYVLYLMFGQKGRQILSPTYQDIIAATPQVRYQRSTADWIALGVLVLLLVGVFVLIMLAVLGS